MNTQRLELQRTLRALAEANDGTITPEAVVAEAVEPSSPLHEWFTWNDGEAAHNYRLAQARRLIRTVRIEISTETMTVRTPYFIRDPDAAERTQGYVTLPRLRSDEDAARAAVVAEFQRASAALTRARTLAVALELSDQVDSLIETLGELRGRVTSGSAEYAGAVS